MLEPQDRRLFLESLRPPDGYTLDRAIGTTYSLDLLALLTAPLAFTMFDFQDNEGRPLADPLALLEAVRRHADRTAVFCQAGEIKVPRSHLLLGYLETSIVEVTARERRGVFHPKVWILRFVAPDERVLYRLVCLSRNLTFDRSWDTILVVEGELVVSRKNAFASNHSLVEFVRALPGLAVRDVPVSVKQIVDLFQDELRRVKFEPPDGYEEMTFWPLGHNAKEKWPFEDMDRALVISPFLSDTLLGRLATEGKDHVLVSRLASLEALKAKTRDQFQSLHVLREGTDGESDAGEVPGGAVGLTGLHAKVYVVDKGWYASVFCGSANATDSAFARNVEFLVELRGKKSKYGVEATLASRDGETSLSSMIEEVKVSKSASGDQVLEALEAVLGEARRAVWEAQVSLHVEDVGENAFRMLVRCAKPLRLPDGVALRCWPITLRDEAAQDLAPQAECLFPLSFEALTAFLAFEATVSSEGQTATCRFVLNLPLVGVPSDRKERLLRSLLRSPEQVMRLLLLLLSEGGLELGALLGELQGESKSTAWGAYGEAHLFESLMRALDRTPHKLDDVAGLFADLSRSEQTRGLCRRASTRSGARYGKRDRICGRRNHVEKPDLAAAARGLKDFQKVTVDYVFDRLYLDPQASRRFLVADEVGLGKTLVARGVIAKVIDHLWDDIPRIDIIYICSNADIARQNISRLNVTGQEEFALASRITMLPIILKDLKKKRLNFISFTPSTTFDLKNNLGTQRERALLYWLLQEVWGLKGAAPLNVLQGAASREGFRDRVGSFHQEHEIDEGLAGEFTKAIEIDAQVARGEGRRDLKSRFDDLCEKFSRSKDNIPKEDHRERTAVVGELRTLLAVTCLEALEPDLIILDEFQRFKHLLQGTDRAGELAQKLFEFHDNRILLLSATPYKMYTLEHEAETDDHYDDFLSTLDFLLANHHETEIFASLLRDYRRDLFALDQGGFDRLAIHKARIEETLRRVMVRTERLAASSDRNGMLTHVAGAPLTIESREISHYLSLQKISNLVEQGDTLHFWKAAPYLLNFMDDYALKKAVRETAEAPGSPSNLAALLRGSPGLLLDWPEITRYEAVDPGNARLRSLMGDTVGNGLWRLLWMPPSLPYYELEGPYRELATAPPTKRLVFSAWRVVPKAIASLLSYEAERQMFRSHEPNSENTPEARKRRKALLRFARADMRLTGMPVLGMLYPSPALARACDPLVLALREDGGTPRLTEVLAEAESVVSALLQRVHTELAGKLFEQKPDTVVDEAWYWAAPILFDCLDDPVRPREWLRREDCAARWSGEEDEVEEDGEPSAWNDHVDKARTAARGFTALSLGPPPENLVRVLAWMGLGGPGVVALRALGRVAGGGAWLDSSEVRDAAGSLAWSLRTLFNLPEVTALVRGLDPGEPYWLKVVEYCANGGLQSVLDEYAHVLKESLGLLDAGPEDLAKGVAGAMREALGLRTAALGVDVLDVTNGKVTLTRHRMRARFALRFGTEESDDGEESSRAEQVRTAFNSPFWPFVLASTSVGQEGLDFHQFCHAVVHWNLPANPVDLEQREGRVHRYKGHAVRKNIAAHYGLRVAREHASDPWEGLFAAAKRDACGQSDIVPFWVFAIEGGAQIERHVPAIPWSRDVHRLAELRRALAVYRMVFGQARQEELVSYLLTHMPADLVADAAERLRIDLTPRPVHESKGRHPGEGNVAHGQA